MARNVERPLGAQAATLLASFFEDMGKMPGAETLYLRLAEDAQLGFQSRGALAAARLRQTRWDHPGALELYDRLLESPHSLRPNRSLIKLRRAEAATTLH